MKCEGCRSEMAMVRAAALRYAGRKQAVRLQAAGLLWSQGNLSTEEWMAEIDASVAIQTAIVSTMAEQRSLSIDHQGCHLSCSNCHRLGAESGEDLCSNCLIEADENARENEYTRQLSYSECV